MQIEWDRSRDWIVQRYFNELTRVTIRFRQSLPSTAELVAVRKCLPQFRNMAPAKLEELIEKSAGLPLGEMPTREARNIIEAAQSQGLIVVAEGASFISYLPIDRTNGTAWLIESDAEAAAVVAEMIAAGVPVQDIEA